MFNGEQYAFADGVKQPATGWYVSGRICLYYLKSGQTAANEVFHIFVHSTSLRHTAEWGMKAVQGSFPHLNFLNDFQDRMLFLNLIPMVNDFCTAYGGLIQI